MFTMSFKQQKYLFNIVLFICNVFLSYCLANFSEFWYLYIFILTPNSLITLIMIFNITIYNIIYSSNKKKNKNINNKNIIFLIPCYNESYDELYETINSFVNQDNINNHKKILIIICDGMVTGKGNNMSTDKILTQQIFKENIIETFHYTDAYKTWNNEYNNTYVSHGIYKNLPFLLIIKENNVGKRDSVTLIRSNMYLYNNKENVTLLNENNYILTSFNNKIFNILNLYNLNNIDAIIGTDGDTVLNNKCANHLINELFNNKDENLVGIAGFIKISNKMNKWSLWTIYQHTSYIYGQVLIRLHQSQITKKVNCLPGCIQILKVCQETCGFKILNEFNRLPSNNEHIFRHMRAHMGEDRMHVCTMMHMYPYIKTKQSIKAFAYTKVPNKWSTFLSQRRRWNLGANSNKLILVSNNNINYFEKLSALFSIIGWFFTIFFTYATIHIIIVLSKLDYWNFNLLIYITVISLLIIVIIPKLYLLLVPLWLDMSKLEIIQLYIGILFWHFMNIPMVLIMHIYTLINMDNLSWGKTRQCETNTYNLELTPRNNIV